MMLKKLEFVLMNNPVRTFIQRQFESPCLASMGGSTAAAYVLEIGCGHGQFIDGLRLAGFQVVAAQHIWNRFGWYVGQNCIDSNDQHP